MSDKAIDPTCHDCKKPFESPWWEFWAKNQHDCQGENCQAKLCSNCFNRHPLMVGSTELKDCTLKNFCRSCFQQKSYLNFDRHYDVLEGNSGTIFVFVHGGTGCRAMFSVHARELQKRFNHKSILLDLPGHGTLVDTPLSLESCKDTLGKILGECGITKDSKEKVVYVGGSLGAYIGFYLIDSFKDIFDGAVLMDCGQNVGPGASYKARVGLVFLDWVGSSCSNATLMDMMKGLAVKSPANYHLVETTFGAGMFFDQTSAQVECLRTVAPADYIPSWNIPVLYMNGTEDHRDSENEWLRLCKDQINSKLIDYEGGDHFFMHDTRFVEDIFQKINEYIGKL